MWFSVGHWLSVKNVDDDDIGKYDQYLWKKVFLNLLYKIVQKYYQHWNHYDEFKIEYNIFQSEFHKVLDHNAKDRKKEQKT